MIYGKTTSTLKPFESEFFRVYQTRRSVRRGKSLDDLNRR